MQTSFGPPKVRAGNPLDRDLQRAIGSGRIVVSGSEKGTHIVEVFQRAPIRFLFPRASAREEVVLVNTAGGIAGGDRFEIGVIALRNSSIAVTSQAAEKVYRALNEPARVATKLEAREAAKLAWLPQETIVFNRGGLIRETKIELFSGAELLALEWLVLGRAAHGEEMVGGHISEAWHVRKDSRLIWVDRFRLTEQVFQHLHRKALLSDCKAVGTLLYFGPFLNARLEFLRDIAPSLQCDCAATLINDLVVARLAARVPSDLKLALRRLLKQFSREVGPGPFQEPKMWSC